jgi:hypothetical protein
MLRGARLIEHLKSDNGLAADKIYRWLEYMQIGFDEI